MTKLKEQIAKAIDTALANENILHPEEVEDPDKEKVGLETKIDQKRSTLSEARRKVEEKTELFAPYDSSNMKKFRNELYENLMHKFVKGNKK